MTRNSFLNSILISALILLSLYLVGWIAHFLAPAIDPVDAELRQQFIWPSLSSKAHDRFIFIAFVVLNGLVIAAIAAAGNSILRTPLSYTAISIVGAFATGSIVLVLESEVPLQPLVFSNPPFWKTLALAVLIGCLEFLPKRFETWARRFSFLTVMILVVSLSWTTRWISSENVSYNPIYTSHFEAVINSVFQIADGATCLVDLFPQYGCYGEYIGPITRWMGSSVSSITAIFTTLVCVSALSVIWTLNSIVKSTALFVAGSILIIVEMNLSPFFGSWDPYFQYHPIRSLFPALSLLVASALQRSYSRKIALLAGNFGGFAIFWNIDSGAAVVLALGGFIFYHRLDYSKLKRWAGYTEAVIGLTWYILGILLAITLVTTLLTLKSGTLPDFSSATEYQRLFYYSGFSMLIIPSFPAIWAIAAVILGLAALCAVNELLTTRVKERDLNTLIYLVFLSCGLLVYYSGRAHWVVFLLSAWPIILISCLLIDKASSEWRSQFFKFTLSALLSFLITFQMFANFPRVEAVAGYLHNTNADSLLSEDIQFIKSLTTPGEKIAIEAENQTTLYTSSKTRPAIFTPSFIETVTYKQLEVLNLKLKTSAADKLFVNSDTLTALFFTPSLLDLKDFELVKEGPGRRLLFYVRRIPAKG